MDEEFEICTIQMNPTLFYHQEQETLDQGSLRAMQNEKLRRLMVELASNPFLLAKFSLAGIERLDVKGFDDLRRLPFTTKRELVEAQEASPPFGGLLTYLLSRYNYLHQTSGTTGRALKWLDTEESWEWWIRCWGYVYRGAGVTESDIVFCAFSFGPYISHWAAITGARRVGALCISGGGMNSEQRLQSILENKCTVLVCTPTYALRLIEVSHEHKIDLRASSLRISVHAGEPGASVPNVKRRIEEGLGTRCFDHAGATEVGAWAYPCSAQDGFLHLNENEFIFEVIHPQTNEPVSEGERGELVVTNLGRWGMPVLRYRTGDLVERITEPCPCGRTLARIRGGVLGRADDMLIVRGVNVYPSMIDDIVRSLPHIVEYQVEIRRVSGLDDLLIKIETANGFSFEGIEQEVQDAFRRQLNIRVEIEHAPQGSLPRYEFKSQRYRRLPA